MLWIHSDQVVRYGGASGLRDRGLLESAVAMSRATFGKKYLHRYPFGMAAAYMFHLVQNHPFVDGNKRTGAASALVFLDLNGWEVDISTDQQPAPPAISASGVWGFAPRSAASGRSWPPKVAAEPTLQGQRVICRRNRQVVRTCRKKSDISTRFVDQLKPTGEVAQGVAGRSKLGHGRLHTHNPGASA